MILSTEQGFEHARGHHHSRKVIGVVLMVGCLLALWLVLSVAPNNRNTISGIVLALLPVGGMVVGMYMYANPIRLRCPECKKNISADEPWCCGLCGHKQHKMDELRRKSFLGHCGNNACGHEPSAYECHFCRKLIYLTPDHDGRSPARSLNPLPITAPPNPVQQIREQRAHKLEEREYETRQLQIDREQLMLAVDAAKYRKLHQEVSTPAPPPKSEQQKRIEWVAEKVAEAEHTCRTVTDTLRRELELHEEIDATSFHKDPEINAHLREECKRAVSIGFESARAGFGTNVQIPKKTTGVGGL